MQMLKCLMVGGLVLVGYSAVLPPVLAAPGAAPGAAARENPVIAGTAGPNLAPGAASSFSPVSPLPSRPPAYQMAPPSVAEGRIGVAPNPGPVTGYGAGGTGRIPGSPSNRPY